jgi:hypothetical protein
MTSHRQHLDPVKYQQRTRYIEQRKAAARRDTSTHGCRVMALLVRGLNDRSKARACAQRLLSDYSYAQLGLAVYMRCRRVVNPCVDPIRAKVVKGKPGRLNRIERAEYATRTAVDEMLKLIDESV